MGILPYPVQYFFCNMSNAPSDNSQDMLQYIASLSLACGAVSGETGTEGLRIDFNSGLRLQVPEGNWHVIIGDYDSGLVFYDSDVSEVVLISVEKYYIHWQVEVYRDGELVFGHVFDPAGQKICLAVTTKMLGDMLTFLPYIPVVRDYYQAEVYVFIQDNMHDICKRLLPDVRLSNTVEEDTYATYLLASGLNRWGWTPIDGRMIPMTQTGQLVLGLPEPAPKLTWPAVPRLIEEPYVCIGVQASSAIKGWHYPHGWDEVTEYLKSQGYRVLCIDRDKRVAAEEPEYSVEMPEGAEDFTGNRPLTERADMLSHAEFFVGLGSGLSWLAYTVDCPVVMIGGFSMYWTEFPTPYRVYNRLVCNGCYNDLRSNWQADPCVRQKKGTEDYLKCSKMITPYMVIQAIDRVIRDRKAGRTDSRGE